MRATSTQTVSKGKHSAAGGVRFWLRWSAAPRFAANVLATVMVAFMVLPSLLPLLSFADASVAPEHVCTDRACRLLCELSRNKGGCKHGGAASSQRASGEDQLDHDMHGEARNASFLDCPRSGSGKAKTAGDSDLRSILAEALSALRPAWKNSDFVIRHLLTPDAHDRQPPTPPPRGAFS